MCLDCLVTLPLAGWCHLCASFLRRWVALNSNLSDHWFYEFWRLSLGQFFLSRGSFLLGLLNFNQGYIVLPRHALASIIRVPGSICYFLHLKKCVRSNFVFSNCILEFLVNEWAVVFLGVHQAYVLFDFLSERLWEGSSLSFYLISDSLLRE